MATKAVHEQLAALEDRQGRLTADLVVKEAKAHKNSPLGQAFEWRIQKAAEKNWLDTARSLIADYKIVWRKHHYTIEVPVYVKDPRIPGNVQGYVNIARLKSDREAALETLEYEFQRVAAHLERARAVAHGLGLEDEIDELIRRVLGLQQRAYQEEAVETEPA
jgi:hypothetical protein